MNARHGIVLTLLAFVFTVGLTFASIELPGLLDAFLGRDIDTLDVATGLNEVGTWKTELYVKYYHLRLIGYTCLALIIILIAVWFITERSGWSPAGALLLFFLRGSVTLLRPWFFLAVGFPPAPLVSGVGCVIRCSGLPILSIGS